MRTAGVVDVVYVNIVTLYAGCVRMVKLAKGGWGSCQQTRDRSGWVFAP